MKKNTKQQNATPTGSIRTIEEAFMKAGLKLKRVNKQGVSVIFSQKPAK